MITVVAALIEQEGRLLICQRRHDDPFPLKWEFPGGKVKPGESLVEALRRELREELGVAATICREIYRTRHRYPEMEEELELVFFAASLPSGNDAPLLRNLVFERIEWVAAAALAEFDFLSADRELIALLSTGALPLAAPDRHPGRRDAATTS